MIKNASRHKIINQLQLYQQCNLSIKTEKKESPSDASDLLPFCEISHSHRTETSHNQIDYFGLFLFHIYFLRIDGKDIEPNKIESLECVESVD